MLATFDYPSSDELMEPLAIQIIELKHIAITLRELFPNAFIPDKPGIYLKNNINAIVDTNIGIYIEKENMLIPIKQKDALDNVLRYSLLTKEGILLIPKMGKYVRGMFCTTSDISANIVNFIVAYITYTLVEDTPWIVNKNNMSMYAFLTDEGKKTYQEEKIQKYLDETANILAQFIEPNKFNMYNLVLNNTSLYVERLCDWRIYNWTINQEKLKVADIVKPAGLDKNVSKELEMLLNNHNSNMCMLLKEQEEAISTCIREHEESISRILTY